MEGEGWAAIFISIISHQNFSKAFSKAVEDISPRTSVNWNICEGAPASIANDSHSFNALSRRSLWLLLLKLNFDSPWINIINVPEVRPCGLEPWEQMDNEVSVYFVLSEKDKKEDCSKLFIWKENLLIQNCIKECVSKYPRFEVGIWTSLSCCPPFINIKVWTVAKMMNWERQNGSLWLWLHPSYDG